MKIFIFYYFLMEVKDILFDINAGMRQRVCNMLQRTRPYKLETFLEFLSNRGTVIHARGYHLVTVGEQTVEVFEEFGLVKFYFYDGVEETYIRLK